MKPSLAFRSPPSLTAADVHDRLAAAGQYQAQSVVACYGMNDGIYYPFDNEPFHKYQEGFRRLIAACEKAGAKVVLMTPAPFDPQPVKDKVLAKGARNIAGSSPTPVTTTCSNSIRIGC